jgi:hypothetical protein
MLICKPLIPKEIVVVKLGLAFITMVFLLSCSSKEEDLLMKMHQQKQNQYKYLQKTEKVQFKENNVTSIIVTATYMNKPTSDIDDKSDENFLIGIYSDALEIESLTSEEFNLTLREVKTKKELKEEADKERTKRKEKRLERISTGNLDFNSTVFKKKKKKDVYLEPIYIKLLDKEDALLEGISFVSEWSQFYLVHYPHVSGNKLTLQIKSKKSKEQIELERIKAELKAEASAKLLKKKQKKTIKKKKKKANLYKTKTLSFAKGAKYAL